MKLDNLHREVGSVFASLLLFVPIVANAQSQITISVRVIDETSQKPIPGNIFYKKDCPGQNCQVIGIFDATSAYLSMQCQKGYEIYATPKPTVGIYHATTREGTFCYGDNARVDMLATPFLSTKYASVAGAAAIATGQYGDAVVLYSQANITSPSKVTEKLVYLSAAKKFGLAEQDAIFSDPYQKKDVPSHLLVTKIKEFQTINGLEADGILGLQTQIAIANNKKPIDVLIKYSTDQPNKTSDRGS
jgi:Putative peptidoglycan binding domain